MKWWQRILWLVYSICGSAFFVYVIREETCDPHEWRQYVKIFYWMLCWGALVGQILLDQLRWIFDAERNFV